MIRVVVADDHPAFVLGLRLSLPAYGLEVVGVAADGEQLVDVVREHEPDVVITDVRMPRLSGIEACKTLRLEGVLAPFIIISTYEDAATVDAARRAGVRAFVRKDEPPSVLAEITRRVVSDPTVRVMPGLDLPALTARELDVLRLMGSGMSNKRIARELGIGVETVKDHCSGVFAKLGVSDRLAAAAAARDLGIIM